MKGRRSLLTKSAGSSSSSQLPEYTLAGQRPIRSAGSQESNSTQISLKSLGCDRQNIFSRSRSRTMRSISTILLSIVILLCNLPVSLQEPDSFLGIDLPHGSITLFGTTFGGSPTNHQFGNPVKRKTSGGPPPLQLPFGNSQPPVRPGNHFAGQTHPPPPPSPLPGFGRHQLPAGGTQSPWNFGPSGSYQAVQRFGAGGSYQYTTPSTSYYAQPQGNQFRAPSSLEPFFPPPATTPAPHYFPPANTQSPFQFESEEHFFGTASPYNQNNNHHQHNNNNNQQHNNGINNERHSSINPSLGHHEVNKGNPEFHITPFTNINNLPQDVEDKLYTVPTERPRAVAEPQYGPSDKVIVYKTVPIILSTKDTEIERGIEKEANIAPILARSTNNQNKAADEKKDIITDKSGEESQQEQEVTTEAERKGREEPSRRNAFNFLENFSLAPLRIFGNTNDEGTEAPLRVSSTTKRKQEHIFQESRENDDEYYYEYPANDRDKTDVSSEYEGSEEILTLEEVLFAGELEEQKKELEALFKELRDEDNYLTQLVNLPENDRIPRKTKQSKNLSGLIQKALKLVKKVEDLGEKRKKIQETKRKSKTTDKTDIGSSARNSINIVDKISKKIEELKEEERFQELKSLIKNQNSITDIIKSETSGLRNLLLRNGIELSEPTAKKEKIGNIEMIRALTRLNDISSLLLRESDDTRNQVRDIPVELKNILQTEIDEIRDILESQNESVAKQLEKVLRFDESRSSVNSDTEVVILKALSKLNEISGILLQEQEENKKNTKTALKALPALAQFIQAETAEIKQLILEQEEKLEDSPDQLDDLQKSVKKSLANDRLITQAIIKLNDITQLLLKNVNFTQSALTNELPAALTDLVLAETSKIRDMIEDQNEAVVAILKESEKDVKAEKLQAVREKESSKSLKQKFLDVLSPFFESTDNDNAAQKDDNDINDILTALAPLIKKSQEEEEKEEREEKKDEKESEEKEEPDLAIEGQKSILQALIKLTNITRTLVDEKEKDASEKINKEVANVERVIEEARTTGVRNDYDYEDDTALDSSIDAPTFRSNRPKSLIEEVALNSGGSRNLHGNQALFEEFVKLAIERQRWENAARVHDIIQGTLTTTDLPSTNPIDYYDYPEETLSSKQVEQNRNGQSRPLRKQQKEIIENAPNSEEGVKNVGKHNKQEQDKRLFGSGENRQQNKHFRSKQNKKFNRPNVFVTESNEEYYDYEYEQEVKPSSTTTKRPRRRPRPSRRTTTSTSTTTTEEPLYYDESYYDYPETDNIEEIESLEEQTPPEPVQDNPPRPVEEKAPEAVEQQERQQFIPPRRHSNNRLFPSRFSNDKRKQSPFTRSQFNERKEDSKETRPNDVTTEERKPFRPKIIEQTTSTTTERIVISEEPEIVEDIVQQEVSVNEQQEPTREPPVFASQTIKAFVDLQLAERRNNILKSEERESLNSIQVSSTESPARFDVITAVPDRTTGKLETENSRIESSTENSRRLQPQVKEIKESEIIHINPVQHNAPTNVEENARDDNVENAGRFEEIASRDPLNEDVDIGPTGTRRAPTGNRRVPTRDRLRDLFMKSQDRIHHRPDTSSNNQDEVVEEKVAEVSVEPENIIATTGRRIRPSSFTRPFNRAVINKETIKKVEEKSVEEEDPIQLLERLVDSSVQKQKEIDARTFLPTAPPSRNIIPSQEQDSQERGRPGGQDRPDFQPVRPEPPTINPETIKITVKSEPPQQRITQQPRFISPRPRFDPRGGNRNTPRANDEPTTTENIVQEEKEQSRNSEEFRSSRVGLPGHRNGGRPKFKTSEPTPGVLIIQEVTKPQPSVIVPNPRLINTSEDDTEKIKAIQPLSLSEAKTAKANRNNLLKELMRNRASPGEAEPTKATTPTSMSPLENLFQIAQRADNSESGAKTIVSVTSSSSSSSVSSSHTSTGARRKKKKIAAGTRATRRLSNRPPVRPGPSLRPSNPSLTSSNAQVESTGHPKMMDLTPEQRRLLIVKETLNNSNPQEPEKEQDDSTGKTKRVLKKKRVSPRNGRILDDVPNITHRKIKVRRPLTPTPYARVY